MHILHNNGIKNTSVTKSSPRAGFRRTRTTVLKQYMFLAACLLPVLSAFCSCSAREPVKRHFVFGATYMTMGNPFFVYLNDGIKGIVEAKGDKLVVLDPAMDQEKQNDQLIRLINQNVDAVFLNPVDWEKITPALEKIRKAGIPVINIDAPVKETELVNCIISSDNRKAGMLIAQDLFSRRKKAGIIVLEHPSARSAADRAAAFMETIKEKKQYTVTARASSDGLIERSMTEMKKILEQKTGFDVVMAINDPTAVGAVAALQEAGRADGILVYGIDGSPDAKRLVAEGKMTATVAQSPVLIGREAATAAYTILSGRQVERQILVPVVLIDKTNIAAYDISRWQ
jgi:ribose transport system substrate-binding protein